MAFGTLHVAPALADFLGRYPELDIDMTIADRAIDLAEEGYDVVVRVARDLPPNLVARRLAPVRRKLCATPEYFEKHGVPRIPQTWQQHNLASTTRIPASRGCGALRGPEGDIAVPVSGAVAHQRRRSLVAGGAGRIGPWRCCPPSSSARICRPGACVPRSEYIPVERHVYALYLPTRHLPAKVRLHRFPAGTLRPRSLLHRD
ncbi:MAG: substrate binding domain-containing protein [Rhodocyclaceae bacterium]|nr:substrate binding domain-containing protein [Rhodocyclaceae bacterium]